MKFPVHVQVRLRPSVYDPQGEAIRRASAADPRIAVDSVRQGKVFDLVLEAETWDEAMERAEALAERVLANPVIEDYLIETNLEETVDAEGRIVSPEFDEDFPD